MSDINDLGDFLETGGGLASTASSRACPKCREAAAEIERLQAESRTLRNAAVTQAEEIERLQGKSFDRVFDLISDINIDRYGKPLITALHLCIDLEAERNAASIRAESAERQRDEALAVIAQHDLCHNLHGKVDANAFAEGCAAEQRKLYGCAPHADQRDEAIAALQRLDSVLDFSEPETITTFEMPEDLTALKEAFAVAYDALHPPESARRLLNPTEGKAEEGR